ncbi:hypothetical protein GCM10027051_35280 [Niabella terrae]
MKKKYIPYVILLAGWLMVFSSCAKDNYDPPSSSFSGRLVYQGEPINLEYNQVNFELWQPGFGKSAAINVSVGQDGNFSSLLFNGNYKLVFTANQGPFYWPRNASGAVDTVNVDISGSKQMDLEVTPYYMIRNPQLTVSGQTLTATCALEKIITNEQAKDVERVSLYINKTQFVSGNNTQNIAKTDIGGGDLTDLGNIVIQAEIPEITPTQNYIFARIGLKIAGVEDMIFSPLQKLSF